MTRSISFFLSCILSALPAFAQGAHIMGIGDSLGEGVQSDNAFTLSQQQGYLNMLATQAQVPFTLPLITSNRFGVVGSASGRSRTDASAQPDDLAVSGATVSDILNDTSTKNGNREVDLVLAPYYGMTQMQVIEQVKPAFVFCWAGNDDLINYILDYSHLNAPTGITPIGTFNSQYLNLMSRLKATGAKVVVGNIADLTKVGFLFDNDDVTKFLGTNYNLPAGSYTTFGAVTLIKLGQASPTILTNPAYVLSATQISRIQNQIEQYNQIISTVAAANGFPVVDTFSIVDSFVTNPITIEGVTITNHYNGGAFSLDGIHPSDTGYSIFANAFLKTANSHYGSAIPPISLTAQIAIFNADPFVDFNGNGVVPGRPNTGLLETLGPSLGISGDTHEHGAGVAAAAKSADPFAFMRAYYAYKGMNPNTGWQKADVERAVSEMLHAPVR